MKYIILPIILLITSCSVNEKIENNITSFTDDLNDAIIDGFYDNDTTNIGASIYLVIPFSNIHFYFIDFELFTKESHIQ